MEAGQGIGFVCKMVKGWVRPNRPTLGRRRRFGGGGRLLRFFRN